MTTLVVDANVVFTIALAPDGLELLSRDEIAAPPLLRSEVRSALHVALWRGLLGTEDAHRALELLESGAVREHRHRNLGLESWRIADELDWAKTYDAEYLALARLLGVPLATLDRRMLLAAERLDIPTRTLA
jgi:predicted nucleic acid-binding protein